MQEFRKIVDRLPDWFQKIATILVQRLREVDNKINSSTGEDRHVHVAALVALLTYTELCSGSESGYVFAESALEHEIVDLLDIPLAEASAALARLQKENLLRMEKGKVVVGDRERLDRYAEELFRNAAETPAT